LLTPKRFGVLGWPVAHSRSPQIHHAAYEALGLDGWRYQRLPVPPELFDETVRALHAAGFDGANVTIPHKEAALKLADSATDAATEIGAANTLTFNEDGTIDADNTDAPGLLAALPASPEGRDAVVLGAGGSARAAVWALKHAGAQSVAVWNRTAERAVELAAELGADAVAAPPDEGWLLVNCTSVGLDDPAAMPPVEPGGFAVVADLVYRAGGTALLNAAKERGARTVDGLEILVQQGALSLERWTGADAPIAAMRLAADTTS
jgi:shikimate dehydrogenase